MLVSGWLLPPGFVTFHVWVGISDRGADCRPADLGLSRFPHQPLQPAFHRQLARGLGELRERMAGHPAEPSTGHNPAGALMVYALLAMLLALVVSGFMAWGGKEKSGPLAAFLPFDWGSLAGDLHSLGGFALARCRRPPHRRHRRQPRRTAEPRPRHGDGPQAGGAAGRTRHCPAAAGIRLPWPVSSPPARPVGAGCRAAGVRRCGTACLAGHLQERLRRMPHGVSAAIAAARILAKSDGVAR